MKIPREFSRPVRIGSGTFSTVYRVYQSELERHVALKILPYSKEKVNTPIDQEMRILASLQLPCVPHIYDVKRLRNCFVLVMEWIRGVPLSLLFKQPLSVECRMAIANSIVKNLALLHANQVIHGDLKPENILVTSDSKVLFVDFGFSLLQSIKNHSKDVVQGTPKFMAPELWSDSDSINHKKVDLYALGIVLREFLGDAFPVVATDLTAADPGLRPSDAVVFEKIWSENGKEEVANEAHCGVVTAAVQEYTARLLLTGARELYARRKSEDAYALLTESLEIWPDQHEALEFLQQKYSSPVIIYGRKRIFVATFAIVTIALLLVLAYFAGTQDSVSGVIGSFSISNEDTPMVSVVLPTQRNQTIAAFPVALRETGGGLNLVGTISIRCNLEEKGRLVIDGTPITELSNRDMSMQLKAGSHRVEWIDSTSRKRFCEIVELLPFEHKKISLRRFVDGKRK